MIFLHEHWFEAAASIQVRMGPIVIRPDGIKDDRLARQYIASVLGILHALQRARPRRAMPWSRRYVSTTSRC